jgi:hypothetical protein
MYSCGAALTAAFFKVLTTIESPRRKRYNSPVSLRALFVCLACCFAAGVPLFGGEYHETRDGKTQVWNNNPQPGDVATWNGDRDSDGYATGFGTLTWYKQRSNDDREKTDVFARYFGKMAHGKLEGVVNVHTGSRTAHAVFVDGKRTGRWMGGPALTRNVPMPAERSVATTAAAPRRETPKPAPPAQKTEQHVAEREADVPAEGPAKPASTPPPPPPESRQAKATSAPADRTPPPAPADGEKKNKLDDSLRALVGPPMALRPKTKPAENTTSSPPTTTSGSWLSKEDAIEMADREAHSSGYDLNQFHRPRTTYDGNEHTWSISYEPKESPGGKHLEVTLDDRTKKVSVISPSP